MSEWYYAVDNQQKGPIGESELRSQFSSGKLPSGTLVWKEGMENWTPAVQVTAFAAGTPTVPLNPPPPATLSPNPAAVEEKPGINNPDSTKPVLLSSLMGPGEALEVDPEDAETHKIFGIIAYLWMLCLVPLFAAKESPFARYHANQGLVLFLVEIGLWIILQILDHVFVFLGLSFISLFLSLLWLGVIGLLIIGIINAAAGKCVPLPIIGGIRLLKSPEVK